MTSSTAVNHMLLLPVLHSHARYLAAKPALVDDSGATTYADLWGQASRVAADLRARGARPGDRVALLMQPSSRYVAGALGVMLAGGVAAPVNTRLMPLEIDAYLERLSPVFTWSDGGLARRAAHAAPTTTRDADHAVTTVDPGAPAIAFPTGGTTGLPKAAVWSHAGLTAALVSACMNLGTTRSDTELYFSPMYHLTLVTGLFAVLLAGGTVRICASFSEETVAAILSRGEVTRFFATPVVIERILAGSPGSLGRAGLRMVVFGASRSAPDFASRLQAAVPATRLMTGYGATEFGAITRVFPDEILREDVGVGRPVAGVHVEICDPDGAVLAPGATGEIVVRSPMQMLGYVGSDGAEASPLGGDWLRSGDIGELDGNGYLHLHARLSELIKTGGESVYPAEVERVVVQHRDVFDAVVYGVEDVAWGERVECAVILAPGATLDEEELRRHCAEQLGRYKVPKRFRVVNEFPRTSTLKLDRRALRSAALGAPV
ncbi:MAG TPA: class I adenylate-forming enzyme family protein [Candidatus Dormibacteraeota bacterium]|jgi:acyl-CoA synthetase (AMP-forming)/AMP-acid ligase II|nr:class I adenylate-forming enzyme family protein [Candidatus Dormibacteraeota bacterium]